jgi:hypothetical protein
MRQKRAGRKNAVSQIGLSNRAQPNHGTTCGDALHLAVGDVSGMNQAPALVHCSMFEQPLHRSASRPSNTIFNFLGLLSDMDVDNASL